MKNCDYSRRQFLKKNSFAGLGTMIGIGLSPEILASDRIAEAGQTEPLIEKPVIEGTIDQLGGMSLPELLKYHQNYLKDIYIPNWERGIDHKYGGFANAISPGQEPDFEKKGTYFQGRAVWMFSYLYNHITHDKKHLAGSTF